MTPRIPLWLKLAYSAWMVVWVPAIWAYNGPANFLWFCDIANWVILIALWVESPLLWSSQAVGVLLIQMIWTVDYSGAILLGTHLVGGTEYMFDQAVPLWKRSLSLFHVAMPPLLIWGVLRLGFERRGLRLQVLLSTMILPTCFFFTDPERNLNWVWKPFGLEQVWLPPMTYLLVVIVLYPILLCLPGQALLGWMDRKWGRGSS